MKLTIGDKEYFKGIGQIKYEGKDSDNPLAFKYYDAKRKVGKKTMEEYLRFAIAYWHTFCGTGGDPFGAGTKNFPWFNKRRTQHSAGGSRASLRSSPAASPASIRTAA